MPGQYLGTLADPRSLAKELKNEWVKGLDFPRVVVVGRSNVGKSSLLNHLLGAKLAYVSSSPGKTKAIHFYRWHKANLIFVDLPGYGFAKVSKAEQDQWRKLVEAYLKKDSAITLALLLLDSRHGPTPDDLTAEKFLQDQGMTVEWVMTKRDTLRTQSERVMRTRAVSAAAHDVGLEPGEVHWVSIKDDASIAGLSRRLLKLLEEDGE